MTHTLRLMAVVAMLSAGTAATADFDGSKRLICAPVMAMDCAESVECVSGTPQDLGAPTFLRIDFEKNEVTGTQRTTPIRQLDKSATQLLLQGVEGELGWTIAIDSEDGGMHATMAGEDGAIILSGSCTTL